MIQHMEMAAGRPSQEEKPIPSDGCLPGCYSPLQSINRHGRFRGDTLVYGCPSSMINDSVGWHRCFGSGIPRL